MPLRGLGTRSRAALFAAMKVYDLVSLGRNSGVRPECRIPPGYTVSRETLYELAPGLRPGYTSGAIWHDGQMLEADRLLLACMVAASEAGAVVLNYAEVLGLRQQRDHRVTGVNVRDRMTGREFEVRGSHTALAAGPWNPTFLRRAGIRRAQATVSQIKNMNVVVPRLFEHDALAVGIESRRRSDSTVGNTNRLFFVTPWKDWSIIGTTHEPFDAEPETCSFDDHDVEEFLGEFNEAYTRSALRREDVLYVYGGLTPGEGGEGQPRRSRHGTVTDHERIDGVKGLWTVTGVKYTTARWLAERAVDAIVDRVMSKPCSCTLLGKPLPGGERYAGREAVVNSLVGATGLEPAQLLDFAMAYGSRAEQVLDRGGFERGSGVNGLLRCRLAYSIREEMAVSAGDLLYRRTSLGVTGGDAPGLRSEIESLLERELGRRDVPGRHSDLATGDSKAVGVSR